MPEFCMSDTQPPPPPADRSVPATLALDTSDVNATQSLYQAAIGPVNAARYLQLFTRFELADRALPSWNWAASLCTLGWMLFRRMGVAALAYLVVASAVLLLASLLVTLVFRNAPELQWGIGLAAALLLLLVPGILGDSWLYVHCRKRMARALADSANWNEAAALLTRQAAAWPRAGWLAAGQLVVLGGAYAAYSALTGGSAPAARLVPTPPQVVEPVVQATQPASAASPAAVASAAISATSASALIAVATVSAEVPAPGASMAAASVAAPPAVPAPRAVAAAPGTAAPPDAPAAGRHMVNVGLFAVASNARAAHARLRAAGLPATIEELQTRNGPRTRVRAGPFASQAAAENAATGIRALGLEAQLVKAASAASR